MPQSGIPFRTLVLLRRTLQDLRELEPELDHEVIRGHKQHFIDVLRQIDLRLDNAKNSVTMMLEGLQRREK